jgi:hypothetical protein
MPDATLSRIVNSLANRAIEAYRFAGAVKHGPENGRAREDAIRQFLAAILPPQYGIDTGFVIDSSGGVSKQVDIVIYRKANFPILSVGGVKFFLVESVAAVLESKASIDSTARLSEALANIASVKALDRTGKGLNRVPGTPIRIHAHDFAYQVWGGIVCGESLRHGRAVKLLREYCNQNERALWPNAYCAIEGFLVQYVTEDRHDAWTSDTSKGAFLYCGGGSNQGSEFSPPLASLGKELINFLKEAPPVSFSMSGYFDSGMPPLLAEGVPVQPPSERTAHLSEHEERNPD